MKKEKIKILTLVLLLVGIFLLVAPIIVEAVTYGDTIHKGTIEIVGKFNAVDLTDLNETLLDQQQLVFDAYYMPYYDDPLLGEDEGTIIQQVMNDRKPMVGFDIAVAQHGSPGDLYIGIRSDVGGSNSGISTMYSYAYLPQDALPEDDTFYLITFEIAQSSNTNPYDGYSGFIQVNAVDDSSSSDNNCWMIAAAQNDVYTRGVTKFDTGNQWTNIPGDFWFRTYTTEAPAPSIGITISTTILSQFFGIVSLIGAVISGVKYYGVL